MRTGRRPVQEIQTRHGPATFQIPKHFASDIPLGTDIGLNAQEESLVTS
jgi:hypothetical protein